MTSPTVERVKSLLRRDLKLGPRAVIADDMLLIGGELDLDSLDVLMVITTIEKEFGIKISGDDSAKEAFRSVATLAGFIDSHPRIAADVRDTKTPPPHAEDALGRLPHRDPFRFVTRIEELRPGEFARATWAVTGNEPFFAGHFPGRPIVPGVLLAEALAQVAGILAVAGSSNGAATKVDPSVDGRLAQVKVRFHLAVPPPAEIALEVRLTTTLGSLADFQVKATVDGHVAADGSLTLSLVPSPAAVEVGK